MKGFDPDIDRRRVLKNLGLAGVGGSALLGTNPVAASSSENKIEDIWGAMVDIAEEKLGEALPWATENVSTEERQRRFRELVGETDDVETEVYVPVELPFNACYWTNYAVSGEKICIESFPFRLGSPECDSETPIMWNADINVKTFEMKIGGDWSLQKSFDIWVGVHDNCIWTGNEDTNTCRVFGCMDDVVDATSSVLDIAEAAFAAATEAVEQWAANHGIPSWVVYAFIVLVAIVFALALFYLGGGVIMLPAASVAGI